MLVAVAGMVVLSVLAGELVGSSGLGGGVQVLNLGLTEDAVKLLVLRLDPSRNGFSGTA